MFMPVKKVCMIVMIQVHLNFLPSQLASSVKLSVGKCEQKVTFNLGVKYIGTSTS